MKNKFSVWMSEVNLGRKLKRLGLMVGIGLILAGGVVFGLKQMENYTNRLAVFTSKEANGTLYNKPTWMSDPLARQILQESFLPIQKELQDLHRRGMDNKFPEVLARELAKSPWVSKVHWVRRSFGGMFVIHADFREPTALVKLEEGCYLIDQEGYLLPGKYKYDALLDCGLLEIHGVKSRLPEPGKKWVGKDLQGGVALVKLLKTVEFRHQVTAVDVTNYEGRCDRNASWLVLETDRHTLIRWGRPAGEEGGLENTADDKVALLRGAYADYHHIDCNRMFVDITRSQNSVDASIATVGNTTEK
jgi:hypothetical protein